MSNGHMQLPEYLIESERTERKFPDGLKIANADPLVSHLSAFITFGVGLDVIKKILIYGFEPTPEFARKLADTINDAERDIDGVIPDEFWERKAQGSTDMFEVTLNSEHAELLHAYMGLLTEVTEIGQALVPWIFGKKDLNVSNMSEEIGDLFWYMAIMMRRLKIDPEATLALNIRKLRQRYPDAFSADKALNRDLDAELKILTAE